MPNIFQNLGDIAQRIGRGITPAPADGLMSPDQIQKARASALSKFGIDMLQNQGGNGVSPNLAQAVGHGISAAQDEYGNQLNSQAAQTAALKQQQMLAKRKEITDKYTPGPNDTPDTLLSRAPAMYMEHLSNGDFEAAKPLEPIVKQYLENQKPKDAHIETVKMGDKVINHNTTTGEYTDPVTGRKLTAAELVEHKNPDQLAEDTARRQERADAHALSLQQQRSMMSEREFQDAQRVGNAWRNDPGIKPLLASEPAYTNWKEVLGQARKSNPAAYKGLITSFANSGDGLTSGLRLGMLNYVQQMDPSYKGSAEIWLDKKFGGVWPKSVLDNMDAIVEAKHKGVIQQYERRRLARAKVLPASKALFLDPASTVFSKAEDYPDAQGAPAVNPFAKGGTKEIH